MYTHIYIDTYTYVCIQKYIPSCLSREDRRAGICIYMIHTYIYIWKYMYSQSQLGWHFRMLFQSSKLKAWTSLFTETWQKRRSGFELWAFENDTPSGIGCTSDRTHLYKELILHTGHIYIKNSLCENDTPSGNGCTYTYTYIYIYIRVECVSYE